MSCLEKLRFPFSGMLKLSNQCVQEATSSLVLSDAVTAQGKFPLKNTSYLPHNLSNHPDEQPVPNF